MCPIPLDRGPDPGEATVDVPRDEGCVAKVLLTQSAPDLGVIFLLNGLGEESIRFVCLLSELRFCIDVRGLERIQLGPRPRDTLFLSGPASSESLPLTINLNLDGILDGQSSVTVLLNFYSNTSSTAFSTALLGVDGFRVVNHGGHQGVSEQISQTFMVPANQEFDVGVFLISKGHAMGNDSFSSDFSHTLTIDDQEPFVIPDGYSLSSEGGTPTQGAGNGVPDGGETALMLLLASVALAASALRRRCA